MIDGAALLAPSPDTVALRELHVRRPCEARRLLLVQGRRLLLASEARTARVREALIALHPESLLLREREPRRQSLFLGIHCRKRAEATLSASRVCCARRRTRSPAGICSVSP
jgi:hypothetical protein